MSNSFFRVPHLETTLQLQHSLVISQLEKEWNDNAENVCCSCQCLFQRKSVTRVKLSDDLGHSEIWSDLKEFLLTNNPPSVGETLYMCNYCKHKIKSNVMTPRCMLNGNGRKNTLPLQAFKEL